MGAAEYLSAADGKYLCTACGANITKKIRRWIPGHGGPKIGPEFIACSCGKTYKTGSTEWDHMSPKAKKSQIRGLVWGFLFILGFLSAVGALFGFLTDGSLQNTENGFLVGLLLGTAFMGFVLLNFSFDLLASIRRTRSQDHLVG